MARKWIKLVNLEVDEETGAVLVKLGTDPAQLLSAINKLLAIQKREPVPNSGRQLTGAGMTVNGWTEVAAGATYTVTAENGTFHFGFESMVDDAKYLVTIPAGSTQPITIPAGVTTIYWRAESGRTARLARIVNT
ncbi:MAG: hypothetical protein JXL80_17525 [Planctomycetes bacterium]|nr:hypothetical protein [Planctomycetota bacterium]